MPKFGDQLGVDLPTGGRIGLDLSFYTDRLDELSQIKLYASDDPATPVDLPGLWYGEQIRSAWREETTRILGADGALVQDDGLGLWTYRLSRILLSDNTIESPISGAVGAAVDALAGAAGLGSESRTCYDELRDIVKIFRRKDKQGARMVWTIESELADIYDLDKIVFLNHRVVNPRAQEYMIVSLNFREYTDFPIRGVGL